MYEVIWHGRGGQGVVVASQILAESAYLQGFKGVTSAPTFGPERRGAPLTASTKISREPIRTFAQIELADVAVVLDPSLLTVVNIVGSVKDHGIIIINAAGKPGITGMKNGLRVATVDAVSIALKHHLIKEGSPMVNTPLLGAFAAATDLITIESLEKGLKWKMSGLAATNNIAALRAAFEATCKLN